MYFQILFTSMAKASALAGSMVVVAHAARVTNEADDADCGEAVIAGGQCGHFCHVECSVLDGLDGDLRMLENLCHNSLQAFDLASILAHDKVVKCVDDELVDSCKDMASLLPKLRTNKRGCTFGSPRSADWSGLSMLQALFLVCAFDQSTPGSQSDLS